MEPTNEQVPGHLGVPETRHDPDLDRLVAALRRVQDRVIGTLGPSVTLRTAAEGLEQVADQLEPYRMPDGGPPSWEDLQRTVGTRSLAPPLRGLTCTPFELTAQVTFTAFYLGGNGAVHGGALPLMFDEVLGRLANTGRPMSRTANLSVDYRHVTPIGRELSVKGWFDRQDGRKRYLRGALLDGEVVTAEVHGLFVELRPGQG